MKHGASSPPHAPGRRLAAIVDLLRKQGTDDVAEALVAELHQFINGLTEPARYRILVLTQAAPAQTDEVGDVYPSFCALNANPFPVWVGVAGGPASAQGRAIPLPSNAAMTFPLRAQDLEIAADPADLAASGDALVHVFRYRTFVPYRLDFWGGA